MKSIEEAKNELDNKVILVRLDLNVPLENGKITDLNRIDKIIPTIKYLRDKDAKLILLSHIGRPKGKIVPELSLEPVKENISYQLNEKIKLIKSNIFDLNKKKLFDTSKEKIIMLENIRFYPEEENNDSKFAEHLAGLGDIYVNEAFSGIKTTIDSKEINLGVTFTDGLADPEINKKTGDIIYIDNRPLVQRDSRQKEDVKIILEF